MNEQLIIYMLGEIRNEMIVIKKDIEALRKTNERLEKHIDFIEETYTGLRSPINYIKDYFGKSNQIE